jgi:hypothetical protein
MEKKEERPEEVNGDWPVLQWLPDSMKNQNRKEKKKIREKSTHTKKPDPRERDDAEDRNQPRRITTHILYMTEKRFGYFREEGGAWKGLLVRRQSKKPTTNSNVKWIYIVGTIC